jgi:hypothetical protein
MALGMEVGAGAMVLHLDALPKVLISCALHDQVRSAVFAPNGTQLNASASKGLP